MGKYLSTPNSVYVRELNGDDRADLVVTQRNGGKTIYLQQEDGSYERLDKLQKQMRNSIEEKVKDIK